MIWHSATMSEALSHAIGRQQDRDNSNKERPLFPYARMTRTSGMDTVWFTDGTGVMCCSDWAGPFSSDTPDIDGEPPDWWIYK